MLISFLTLRSPPTDDHPLPVILIDFRHYSDPTKPHKYASIPVISLRYNNEHQGTLVLSIDIAGENMAVLITFPEDVPRAGRLYVFNWKSGIEKTVSSTFSMISEARFS